MSRELWKGNEAIAEAAIRGGVEAYLRLSDHPPDRASGIHVVAHARAGPRLPAGRERGRVDQHGVRRGQRRRARHDFILQPRHQPDAGRPVLHRRLRGAGRAGRRHARRPRPRQHPAQPIRLLPDDPLCRPRRLSPHRAGALHRAGSRRPDVRRLPPGGEVSHARHPGGRRLAGPDDGAGRDAPHAPTADRGRTRRLRRPRRRGPRASASSPRCS